MRTGFYKQGVEGWIFPEETMKDKLKTVGILVAGWVLVFLGIIGLFLPLLQGILLLMLGLSVLSLRSRTIQRFLKRLEARYPQHYERVLLWSEKIKRWFKREV